MPNRLVREGFLDSEAIHALSDSAECFYHRLLLAVDDAGRMDGRVEILRSRLFPLDSSRRASDVEKWLSECVANALVIPYEWKSQRFLQLSKWQRCSPCVTSKFPWRDGTFRIDYIKVETRDGEKDFAATSIGIPIPSVRDGHGIDAVIPRMSGDVDGVVVVVVVEDVEKPPPAEPTAKPARDASLGSRLPADWQPTETERAWAAKERPDLDLVKEADKFRDHWSAKAGKDGRKSDWPATWRNWIRNAGLFRGGTAQPIQRRRNEL